MIVKSRHEEFFTIVCSQGWLFEFFDYAIKRNSHFLLHPHETYHFQGAVNWSCDLTHNIGAPHEDLKPLSDI